MQIAVKDYNRGFWGPEPVTVQRFEPVNNDESFLVYCNHARATLETVTEDVNEINGPDTSFQRSTHNCHRCGAYRIDGDDQWQNAPGEGKHYED